VSDTEWLAAEFEQHRSHLRAVAYRMLGSVSEADDAVQEAWIRLARSESTAVENLGGWLTTVVSRVCLNVLRARRIRQTQSFDAHVPDPIVAIDDGSGPDQEAVLADSIGLALLVVLDTLPPAERLAFVLHDLFAVPFDDVAEILDRTPAATRQLASRARRRVQGATPEPDPDPVERRRVVDAFFAAARHGDFDALVELLDPDVVLRADFGSSGATAVIRGAQAVAGRALMFADPARRLTPALVNGAPGVVVSLDGQTTSVMAFAVSAGRIVSIDTLGDAERLARLGIAAR
jgi:RNA polymerase sigma factor (sigma-70 family)